MIALAMAGVALIASVILGLARGSHGGTEETHDRKRWAPTRQRPAGELPNPCAARQAPQPRRPVRFVRIAIAVFDGEQL